MELSCNLGTVQCDTEEEVKSFLSECVEKGSDDLWIYHGEDEYPCLVLMLNESSACIHYFASNREQFQSAGDEKADGETVFRCAGEESAMPNYTIVPLSAAIACAVQFLHTKDRPTCIAWNTL